MIQLIQDQIPKIEELCKAHRVERLFVFGSAVGNEFNERYSDIDLVVEFSTSIAPEDMADVYFSLLETLKALFKRDVDLLSFRAIKNPVIKDAIESSKILLYAA